LIVEVISPQFNEVFLRPFFESHYSWADRLTIVDQEMPNGIDDILRVKWINEAYKRSSADWVLFVDADEFVFTNKTKLSQITPGFNFARCCLCDVYKHESECGLDVNLPVKWQRRHGVLQQIYQKPCIVRGGQNIVMGLGNHTIQGDAFEYPIPFLGAHWKNADLQYAIDTRIKLRRDRFSELNRINGFGVQDFDITEEQIKAEHEAHKNDPQLW